MAVLQEITRSLKQLAHGGGVASDDTRLTDRHLAYLVGKYRGSILIDLFRKTGNIDVQSWQEITLELKSIDKAICSPILSGCTMKTAKIPSLISLPDNQALSFVGSPAEVSNGYPVYPVDQVSIMLERRIVGGHRPIAYLVGNDLRIESKIPVKSKYIKIRGLFAQPEKVECIIDGQMKCYDEENDPYPIGTDILDLVTRSILTFELRIAQETLSDEVNSARDDLRKQQYSRR